MVHYRRPRSMAAAVEHLASADGAGRVLLGGTDLLLGVRRDPLQPLVLVDLKTVEDLPPAIDIADDVVRFGPAATMTEIAATPDFHAWFPALVQASQVVGSPAIRNRATLIGNICNASPAADTAPALLIYGATVRIVGPAGERAVPLQDFFVGPGQTQCGRDELVAAVEVQRPSPGTGSAFERLTRRRGVDLATVNVAAVVTADGHVALGLGAVGPTPLLSASVSPTELDDAQAVDTTIRALVQVAAPISDIRAGREYREAMTLVLARRAVQRAYDDATRDATTRTGETND